MGMVKMAGVALVLVATQAFAASTVDYTVELSPYNGTYVANYKAGGTARTYFTVDGTFGGAALGNPADNQQYPAGGILTWDLKVAVSGNHSQAGHPSDGKPVAGLANLVFNLQLEKQNGANWDLVAIGAGSATSAGWYSAINDGTNGNPVAAAAMALSYNVNNKGPGRAIDAQDDFVVATPNGGPKMGLFTYPTVVAGKLLGQGCGYTAWDQSGASQLMTAAGVGMTTITRPTTPTTTAPGLGIKPICEGQINTTGLAVGTYRLKVTKGAGVNVLRGDLDLYILGAPSFAVAANVVNEDTVTFQIVNPGQLAVTITPSEAVTAGAQFAINGGFWQDPGTINLAPGTYTVSYKTLVGWNKPADAQVTVAVGGTTPVTGAYAVGNGTLAVTLTPPAAVAAGAQFAVDGGAWQDAGQVSLAPGTHQVTFKPVAGFVKPAAQNPTITPGGTTSITGMYTIAPTPSLDTNAWDGFIRTLSQGQIATADSFTVRNTFGAGEMAYSVSANQPWITLAVATPGDGVVIDAEVETVTVTYDTTSLATGTYYGLITIDSPDADNTPIELPIELTVQPAVPTIAVSIPQGFTKTITQGESAVADTFTVSNATGAGAMNYSVSANQSWLSAAIAAPGNGTITGTETESVNVTYTTAALTPGTYNATITITAAGATNTPVQVPVSLTVNAIPIPPVLVNGVASIKMQGGVAYGIPFIGHTVTTNAGGATSLSVECRTGGVTQVWIPFDGPITAVDGSIDAGAEIVVTGGTITNLDLSTSGVIVVNMTTANQNGSCVTILVHNIAKAAGGVAMADQTLAMKVLRGDVTGDGQVLSGDVSQVKAASGQPLDSTAVMFRRDLNCDGSVLSGDVTVAKGLSGNSAPSCP